MSSPLSISDSLVQADWEDLAYALKTIESGIGGDDAEAKRLRARLGVTRILIYEKIRGWNGASTIDLSFFIGSFKTIQALEKDFDRMGVKRSELLTFLKLLFYKFEKQKLIAKKPLAALAEFSKMKGVVENGRGPL